MPKIGGRLCCNNEKHRKSEEKRKVNRKFVTILIGSLCKLNVEFVWLDYGHVATWSESSSAGEGLSGRRGCLAYGWASA